MSRTRTVPTRASAFRRIRLEVEASVSSVTVDWTRSSQVNPPRLLCVDMFKLITNSARLCQATLGGGIALPQTCMPQLAACALASRFYSTASLREQTVHSAQPGWSRALNVPCTKSSFALQALQSRTMSKLTPKFKGSKLKPYSSYRERFKTTATGLIVYKRPGHRHKRFSKGPHRNRQLRRSQVLTNAYTATMQRLGFVSRRF